MSYIFMDESGDLGFKNKKNTSKNFLITFLFVKDKKQIDRQIKKVFINLPEKIRQHHSGTFRSNEQNWW